MDSKTIEWLAEKLDWFPRGPRYYRTVASTMEEAWCDNVDVWHLTPAGAWEVVTKTGWWLYRIDQYDQEALWAVSQYIKEPEGFSLRSLQYPTKPPIPLSSSDPIRAVELAVIAMRGESDGST